MCRVPFTSASSSSGTEARIASPSYVKRCFIWYLWYLQMVRSRILPVEAEMLAGSSRHGVVLVALLLSAAQMVCAQSPACGSTVVSNNFNRYIGSFRPWTEDEAECGALWLFRCKPVVGCQPCATRCFPLHVKTFAFDTALRCSLLVLVVTLRCYDVVQVAQAGASPVLTITCVVVCIRVSGTAPTPPMCSHLYPPSCTSSASSSNLLQLTPLEARVVQRPAHLHRRSCVWPHALKVDLVQACCPLRDC